MSIRVNLNAVVNAADIRREQHNGREHIVIPSYTLPSGVIMNGGMYPAEEIDRSYRTLENTLAPLGHPTFEGEFISANAPEAINAFHVGAFNRNVEKRGNRVYVEKWLDVETANRTEAGRSLLAAVEAGEPIHTSTGVMLRQEAANGDGYDWIARDMTFDHDAILLGQIGAATPEQGVGMMVNVANALPVGERVLSADTWGARFEALTLAVRERFGSGEGWACVENFDGDRVVFSTQDGKFYIPYSLADGGAMLDGEPVPVQADTSYFVKGGVVNKFLQWFRNAVHSEPVETTPPLEDQDMTPEELQAALEAHGDKMTQAVNAAVEPLATRLVELEQSISANAETALADKRAQAAEAMGVEADTLKGMTANQLDAVLAKVAPSVGLVPGPAPVVNTDALKSYDEPAE